MSAAPHPLPPRVFVKAKTLADRVQAGRPIAFEIVADGIGNIDQEDGCDMYTYVHSLIGDMVESKDRDAIRITLDDYNLALHGALAIGIALGQLLHPDVFRAGGAR